MQGSPQVTQITKLGPYWIIENGFGRTIQVFNYEGKYLVHDVKEANFNLISSKEWKDLHKDIQIFNKEWW